MARQRSWKRVITRPSASSSRYFAGRIRRPFSSSFGVWVPRNTDPLLHSRSRVLISTARHFTPLSPTTLPPACASAPKPLLTGTFWGLSCHFLSHPTGFSGRAYDERVRHSAALEHARASRERARQQTRGDLVLLPGTTGTK